MTDLTKNTTPFGLLDAKTKKAFESHPGVIEEWSGDAWEKKRDSTFYRAITYRVRPEPPKPREAYVLFDDNGIPYKVDEEPFADAVLFREVLP